MKYMVAENFRDNFARTLKDIRKTNLDGTERELAGAVLKKAKTTEPYQSSKKEHLENAKDDRYERLVAENAELKKKVAELERGTKVLEGIKTLLTGGGSHQEKEQKNKKELQKLERLIKANEKELQLVLQEIDKYPVDEHDVALLGSDDLEGAKGIMIHDKKHATLVFSLHTPESLEDKKDKLEENQERVKELKRVLTKLIEGDAWKKKDKDGSVFAFIKPGT